MERLIPGGAPTQRAKWLKELPSFHKPPNSAAFVFGQTWPSDLGRRAPPIYRGAALTV